MRFAWVMVVVVGLGILTGCGGDSSDSTRSTAESDELSKSEWIAQVEGICKAQREDTAPLNKKLDRLNDSGLTAPGEIAEYAAILRKAIPRSERALRESRELEPPSEDSDAVDAMLDKSAETLDLIEKTVEKMEEGSVKEAKLLSFKAAMARRTGQLMAQRYGLRDC